MFVQTSKMSLWNAPSSLSSFNTRLKNMISTGILHCKEHWKYPDENSECLLNGEKIINFRENMFFDPVKNDNVSMILSRIFSFSSISIILLSQACVFFIKIVKTWQYNKLGQTTSIITFICKCLVYCYL